MGECVTQCTPPLPSAKKIEMVEEITDGTYGSGSRSYFITSLLGRQNTYHLVEPASNQKEYKIKSGRTIVYWNFLEVRKFEPFFPKTEKAKKGGLSPFSPSLRCLV